MLSDQMHRRIRMWKQLFVETEDQEELPVTMKNEWYMYLPTLTEEEFVNNFEAEDFFWKSGNPVIIRTKAGESTVVVSAELYDRMAELCGFPGMEARIRSGSHK